MVKLYGFMVHISPKCKKSKKKERIWPNLCFILFFLWLIVSVGINKLGDLARFDYRRSPQKGEIYIKDESYIEKKELA